MIVIRCETGDDVQVEGDTLIGANLARLNLHRALLEGQDLREADLSGSELRSARLEGAVLDRAKLAGAIFFGADVRCDGLETANLRGARADSSTRWPEGFDPAKHGVLVTPPA